jgi:hypothetical protein
MRSEVTNLIAIAIAVGLAKVIAVRVTARIMRQKKLSLKKVLL